VLVGTYSHLPDRVITHSEPDTSMAYYRPGGAQAGADLAFGFERRTERDPSVDEHLDGLCEALAEAWSRDEAGERVGGIVTWRGMMTR
jgi:RAT1-interacting protein